MEWFYLPVRGVQTDYDTFNWAPLEAQLNAIAGRGHQATFRFYLDYPDTRYGVPDFLANVAKRAYDQASIDPDKLSYAPDYENPDLRRALKSFIAAFGKRYDGDPRIGFITVGLLGFWGEWHTYPHEDWMASATVQGEVLDAYAAAFTKTKLLVREPKPGIGIEKRNIGFHDDSFAYATLGPTQWHFLAQSPTGRNAGDLEKPSPSAARFTRPIKAAFGRRTTTAAFLRARNMSVACGKTHASWLMSHSIVNLPPDQKLRAIEASRLLGYDLSVSGAQVESTKGALQAQVEMTIGNRGVAPFLLRLAPRTGGS